VSPAHKKTNLLEGDAAHDSDRYSPYNDDIQAFEEVGRTSSRTAYLLRQDSIMFRRAGAYGYGGVVLVDSTLLCAGA
jgi:hypothetical protein